MKLAKQLMAEEDDDDEDDDDDSNTNKGTDDSCNVQTMSNDSKSIPQGSPAN